MNPSADGLSPQQKLAQSRQRLLDAIGDVPMVSNTSGEPMLGRKQPPQAPRRPRSLAGLPARLRDSTAAQWAVRWWSHHQPAPSR